MNNNFINIQLIVELLKPKLIDVLVAKCDRQEFEILKNDLIKASICTSQEKDEYLVKCKLKHSIARNNCVSKQGFMTKYRLLLSMAQQDKFDFINIAEHAKNIYINSDKLEEPVLTMFKEYDYLLNEDKSLSFEQIKSVYLTLGYLKNPSLTNRESIVKVFAQIEINLSEKIEDKILNNLGKEFAQSELQDQLNAVLNQRIKDVEGQTNEIMLRKSAFYQQIFKLANEKDNDKTKKVTIVLTYCNGGLGAGECQQLDSASRELLKKCDCDANDEHNAFEQIIFKLSKYQYDMLVISLKLNDQTIDQNEQKCLQTKLKDLVDILNVKSNSQMINALKIYANKLEENKLNEERRKKLSKFCLLGKESDFLKEAIKLHKDVEAANWKKLVNDVLMSSLSEQFVVNTFVLGLLIFYKSSRKTNNEDFVYNLIDLVDIEQSLNQNKYNELLDYLEKLRLIPKKYTIKLIERIEFKLKCLTDDVIDLANKLSQSNGLVDKNAQFVLSVTADLSQSIGLVTKQYLTYLTSFHKTLNNYKIQLSELENARSSDQCIIDKLRDQFIDSIDLVFIDYFRNKDAQLTDETNFEKIFNSIKESSHEQTLSQFIHYLNIRLNLKIETGQVKALDRILIESELRNWPRNKLNSFMIEQALQMLAKSYMIDLVQKTQSIQSQIESKQHQLNTLLIKLVDIYKIKNIQNLEAILNEMVNLADSKESASDIELYLIEKVNSIGFEGLDNEQRQQLAHQSEIDQLTKLWINTINKYIYSEPSGHKNLIEQKAKLHNLMRAKCYKVNNYSAFIDRPQYSIKLVNLSEETNFVVDKCQMLFDDICLSQTNKISAYYQLINSNLEKIELDLFTLEEFEIKNKLNDVMCFELDQELKEIRSRREQVIQQICQNVHQLKNEQVRLLDRKSLNEFNSKFEQDFNKILMTCDQDSLISKKLRSVYTYVSSEKHRHTFKAYIYLNYRAVFDDTKVFRLTSDYLNKIGEFVLADWHSLSIKSDFINLQLSTQDFDCLDL
ncbi:hypothetical protein BpHYR1_045092, partial [Brachionus plicatilis]